MHDSTISILSCICMICAMFCYFCEFYSFLLPHLNIGAAFPSIGFPFYHFLLCAAYTERNTLYTFAFEVEVEKKKQRT